MAKKLIHQILGLNPGHYTVNSVEIETWGSQITFDCIYRYPPDEKLFRLIFEECRSLEWYIQRDGDEIRKLKNAQLLAHDLGEGNHQRTARIATTLVEVIISYGRLKIERDWE